MQFGTYELYSYLDDCSPLVHPLADLADVDGVAVALALGGLVHVFGVLPGLGQGTIVPDVTYK